jgi:hypothetical protein
MDSAEKLRERVAQEVRDADVTYVLRAIVEELGLDIGRVHTLNHVADVIDAEHGGPGNGYAIAIREAAVALSTLLHAAGFTPTEDPR